VKISKNKSTTLFAVSILLLLSALFILLLSFNVYALPYGGVGSSTKGVGTATKGNYVIGKQAIGNDIVVNMYQAVPAEGNFRVKSACVVQNYLATGDMLFTAEIINTYANYYPDLDSQRYFQIQLISTDGFTIIATTPLWAWEDVPVSIYLNPTKAATITYGNGYIIRMVGIFPLPPVTDYTLLPTDWHGTDLASLDAWIFGTARSINTYNSWWSTENDMITVSTDQNLQLTNWGGGYFTAGIPAISAVRHNIFSSVKDKPLLTINPPNNIYDSTTWVSGATYSLSDKVGYIGVVYNCILAGVTTLPDTPATDVAHWAATADTLWKVQVGTKLASDADTFGSLFAIDGDEFLGFAIMVVIILITCLGMGLGGKALPLLVLNFPLLMWGNQMRVIGITFTVVICIIMAFLFIRSFYTKST
jgi:hypothetical protein